MLISETELKASIASDSLRFPIQPFAVFGGVTLFSDYSYTTVARVVPVEGGGYDERVVDSLFNLPPDLAVACLADAGASERMVDSFISEATERTLATIAEPSERVVAPAETLAERYIANEEVPCYGALASEEGILFPDGSFAPYSQQATTFEALGASGRSAFFLSEPTPFVVPAPTRG